MWAIVNDIPAEKLHMKDETSITCGDLFRIDALETLLSLGLENKVLTKISNAIEQTGLGSLQDVYLSIIPPLSCTRKFLMDAIVEFI
jgi:geranylgeranyl pyrophosphate synthase